LAPPPVKALAQQQGVPVLQPLTLRRPAATAALARFTPEVGIVAAYGKILPPDVLALPGRGHLNVHASLLPRWRGAWPVGAAILAGDTETGVTIMQLDEGMDTGGVLAERHEPIQAGDTTETLERRLAALGAALLVETLPGYLAGTLVPRPQDDAEATYCRPIHKAEGQVDWAQPAAHLERQVRAMQPWPGAYTTWNGRLLHIVRAHLAPAAASAGGPATPVTPLPPGTVVPAGKGAAVVTGDGWLVLDEVQLEGRAAVPVRSFVNGYRAFAGSRLGS
jgi:methionyl-tRNA formyltransferase